VARASISQSIQPTQRAILFYAGGATVPTTCRNKTSLVIPGRSEFGNPGLSEANAAGALCIQYLNISVFVNVALYHNWLYSTNSGAPALTAYGSGGTTYGPPINWLALSDAQIRAKFDSTCRKMKNELPWMKGLLLDDGGPDWTGYSTLSSTVKEQFYQKHVVIATKIAELADEFGWFIQCNGEWRADQSHGYPVRTTHGCSLYDSFCVEHHGIGEAPFWDNVSAGQWRLRDPNGQRPIFHICNTSSDTTAWRNRTHVAWIAQQTTPQYTVNPPPVATQLTPHDIGLTFGSAPTGTITVTPNPVTVQTGTTQQFTATVSGTTAVTSWTVNGVVGGATATGTITNAGLYSAPVSAPPGGVVTVGASNASSISGSSSVTVTQAAPPPAEAELGPPPDALHKTFGNRFSGLLPNNMTPDFSRGVFATSSEAGSITHLVVGIDGGGPGSANQVFKARIYAVDAAGNPGELLGSSGEYTISDGSDPQWVQLVLDTPVNVTANGVYLLAIHTGGTEATGRFFRNDNSGVSRSISDTYADGPVPSYIGSSVGSADISIYADYIATGTTTAALAGSTLLSLNLQGSAQNESAVSVLNVMQVLTPVTRNIPLFFEDLGDGQQGARVRWNEDDEEFQYLQ
jgi:hypothetical protein